LTGDAELSLSKRCEERSIGCWAVSSGQGEKAIQIGIGLIYCIKAEVEMLYLENVHGSLLKNRRLRLGRESSGKAPEFGTSARPEIADQSSLTSGFVSRQIVHNGFS
jgi:hypothetical protein